MGTNFKYYIGLFIGLAFLISCDEDETTYEPLSYPANAFISIPTSEYSILEDSATPIEIKVEYANSSSAHNSTVTSGFTITSDDAVEGVDYTIVDNKSSVRFTNGDFVDYIQIQPLDNGLQDGDKTLTLTLDNGNVTVGYPDGSGNKSSATITLLDDDCDIVLADLDGIVWKGADTASDNEGPNPTQIVTAYQSNTFEINRIAYGWITGTFWQEEVLTNGNVVAVIDTNTGNFTIDEQYLCTTTFNGSLQPDYSIRATGKYYPCQQEMVVDYELIQNGAVLRSYTENINY